MRVISNVVTSSLFDDIGGTHKLEQLCLFHFFTTVRTHFVVYRYLHSASKTCSRRLTFDFRSGKVVDECQWPTKDYQNDQYCQVIFSCFFCQLESLILVFVNYMRFKLFSIGDSGASVESETYFELLLVNRNKSHEISFSKQLCK